MSNTPVTPAYLDWLQALCDAATPGEWEYTATAGGKIRLFDQRPIDEFATIWGADAADVANAEFIAAARTAVPELIAEVRRLRAVMRNAVKTWSRLAETEPDDKTAATYGHCADTISGDIDGPHCDACAEDQRK